MPAQNEATLKELLRPGLRAVLVGINPAPISVKLQHDNQGRPGKRFWRRLRDHGLLTELPDGREDEFAFSRGFDFRDGVRRPTRRASELSRQEIQRAVPSLVQRLQMLGEPLPVMVLFSRKLRTRWPQHFRKRVSRHSGCRAPVSRRQKRNNTWRHWPDTSLSTKPRETVEWRHLRIFPRCYIPLPFHVLTQGRTFYPTRRTNRPSVRSQGTRFQAHFG